MNGGVYTEKERFFSKGYFLIAAGLIFLINPSINILDIIPDVFGYILIYFGLKKLAFLNERIENARNCALYLIIISAVKLIFTGAVFSSQNSSDKLLGVFCFSLIELLPLMIFRNDFFEGFSYLADRNNGEKTAPYIDNAKFLTLLFFIIRIALPVIPELYTFPEQRMSFDVSNVEFYGDILKTKSYVNVMIIVITLITGILWYISFIKMLRAFRKDAEFTNRLSERYGKEYLSEPGSKNYRGLKIGTGFIIIGCLFFIDYSLDGIRYMPEAAAYLFICAGACFLSPVSSFAKTFRAAYIAVPIGALYEVFRYLYLDESVKFIDQTPLPSVLLYSAASLAVSASAVWFMYNFYNELEVMTRKMIKNEYYWFGLRRAFFFTFTALHALELSLPSVAGYTKGIQVLLTAAWVFLMVLSLTRIKNIYNNKILYNAIEE